ncbi:MAG: GxxExxY protein [Verrucomicrobiales bacterium]
MVKPTQQNMEPPMNTNKHELLLKEEVFQVVGCAMEVLNTLGHGLLEKPYENALAVEFRQRGIPFQQQPRFPVIYKSVDVGEYIPDLIAFDSIIIDTKAIQAVGNFEKAQIINYLKITGLRVGLILNFKHAQLEWQRIVL